MKRGFFGHLIYCSANSISVRACSSVARFRRSVRMPMYALRRSSMSASFRKAFLPFPSGKVPRSPPRDPRIPYSPAIRRWLHRAHILSFPPAGLPWPGGFLVPFLHPPPRVFKPVSGAKLFPRDFQLPFPGFRRDAAPVSTFYKGGRTN